MSVGEQAGFIEFDNEKRYELLRRNLERERWTSPRRRSGTAMCGGFNSVCAV